ncbi:uncharacterized protein LOC110827368 isoform X2 [Zootermopsis nevadensis]|uniref:uncharacterized protein LOC110827368 isoform X2 n=1 Tax=Zootermopsis nevadensis TaxID=136037 RepID=UPI000B8ED433|nr:uncharacterized protein LOC110827368 isoform X2 [Zootermopsis nevadensis]
MGRTRRRISLSIRMLFLCVMGAVSTFGEIHGCGEQKDCLRCDMNKGSGNDGDSWAPHCIKCAHLIVMGSRQCVDRCPAGYREDWSSFVSYMGRICYGRSLAIVVGTISGAAICMGVLLGSFLYLRNRRHRITKTASFSSSSARNESPDHDTLERKEFVKHLSTLRCEAPVFLAMLNDTRRQVRELYHTNGRGDSAVQAYRPVLTDLARILTLLNRPEHLIESPPADWEKLLAWGERVLRRYKKQNPHQVAQAQLVSFLQVPIQTNQSSTPSLYVSPELNHRTLTTFQPVATNPSETDKHVNCQNNQNHHTGVPANQSLQELAISTFDNNYNNAHLAGNDAVLRRDATVLQPSFISGDFNPCWEFSPSNYTILAEWSASRDYLDEDDFFTLGFRPQDEITTEL